MTLIILTGSSKGIGESLKNILTKTDTFFVVGISRTKFTHKLPNYKHIKGDLALEKTCKKVHEEIEILLSQFKFSTIVLINNASTLGEINQSKSLSSKNVFHTLAINLCAPIVLQNTILDLATRWKIPLEIINISSGAASKPYYGWEVYCASKAGLLMASQVFAQEIDALKIDAKIWNLNPGVVDTDMQKQIRECSETEFIQIERFKNFKTEGKLLSPDIVASFIASAINNENFSNGGLYDIRNFI